MLGFNISRASDGADKDKDKGVSKDLQRLNRYDLLELLIGQIHENDELRHVIEDGEKHAAELSALSDRLKDKLDLKDEQIEHLKEKLNLKDEQIENLKKKLDQKDAQFGRLKGKLDDKDAQIEKLKSRLDAKDALIARLSSGETIDPHMLEVLDARSHVAEQTPDEAEAKEPSQPD